MKKTVTVSGKAVETEAATLEALAAELFPGHPDAVNPIVEYKSVYARLVLD